MITAGVGCLGDESRARLEEIRNAQDPLFLIDVFRAGGEAECSAACDALVKLPVTKFEALIPALKDPKSSNVRKWAAISIGRMEEAFFAPQLAALLKDRCRSVRDAAYSVLRDLLDAEHLLGLIGKEMETAKGKAAAARLGAYSERAFKDFQLMRAGLDDGEVVELSKRGLVVRKMVPPASRPAGIGKRALTN